jgi:hypothetical protein
LQVLFFCFKRFFFIFAEFLERIFFEKAQFSYIKKVFIFNLLSTLRWRSLSLRFRLASPQAQLRGSNQG